MKRRQPEAGPDTGSGRPLLDRLGVKPGMRVAGPGIVDQRDTTIVVPRGWVVSRDGYRNFVLTMNES